MLFHDRAPLEKVRRLADGRIAAVCRFARSGVQQYAGSEVGRPDLTIVNVFRPESEVFDEAAMASFAHKSITLGHPIGGVTTDNWKQVAAGWTEGKVARDGEYVEIPLMLADATAIRAYDSGEARELSAGYACDLVWGDGVAPDGTAYQATQRQLRGDHIAMVPQGRAGQQCRIGDSMQKIFMSDAERGMIVAKARSDFDLKYAHLHDRAPQFTDEMAQAAVSREIRSREGRAAVVAQHTADAQTLQIQQDAARALAIDNINAWRRQRYL